MSPEEIRARAHARYERRFANLPKWAQREIKRLEEKVAILTNTRTLAVGDTLILVPKSEWLRHTRKIVETEDR